MAANTSYDFERVAEQLQHSQPMLAALLAQLGQDVEGAAAARQALTHVVSRLRQMDVALGGGHTRAADILQLYAATQVGGLAACCALAGDGLACYKLQVSCITRRWPA
jgi:hypothetical protein